MFFLMYFEIGTLTLHVEGPYHIITSPLICSANQWTGFYMRGTSVMKEIFITQLLSYFHFKSPFFFNCFYLHLQSNITESVP